MMVISEMTLSHWGHQGANIGRRNRLQNTYFNCYSGFYPTLWALCAPGVTEREVKQAVQVYFRALWQGHVTGRCGAERNLLFRTPLDYVFYASLLSNVFSILGVAGVLNQQRELVMAFFTYNTIAMVALFHYFVDICADVGLRYSGQSRSLDSYEQSAAGTILYH